MMKHWKPLLGVSLVFVCGWLAGMLCTSLLIEHRRVDLYKHGSAAMTEMLEHRTTRNLHLDAEQQKQVHAVILESMQQRKRLQGQLQPQIQALNRQMSQEIMPLLRPDQQEAFRANMESFRKRSEKVENASANGKPPVVPPGK